MNLFSVFLKSPSIAIMPGESDWKLLRGIKKRALTLVGRSAGAIWRQLLANRERDEHFYLKWRKLWRHRHRSPFGLKSERVAPRCAFCPRPKSSLRQRQVAAMAAKAGVVWGKGGLCSGVTGIEWGRFRGKLWAEFVALHLIVLVLDAAHWIDR